MPPDAPALDCRSLTKAFSGVPVLRDVSFSLAAGTVLGIAGENGAGKSTLMNVVGGVVRPDSGAMSIDGVPYAPETPMAATARGVAFVHQELNLFPNLSIADNLFLTGFPTRGCVIDRRTARDRAAALLTEVGLAIPSDTLVERLSPGERQLIEIARAVGARAGVVILDEPTTSLARREAERLFRLLATLTARGIAVLYISHALDDLLRLCSRILVLRDGATAAEGRACEFTNARLVTAMVGRSIDQVFPPKPSRSLGPPVLEADAVSQPGVVHNVSFAVRAGEVLGIAGLMGSGRTELARILFGLDRHASGEVRLKGEPVSRLSTRARIARGLSFVTESRRDDGLFLDQAVDPNLRAVTHAKGSLTALIGLLGIRSADPLRQPVRQLSGGNQQKVALGKWLTRRPAVLILDEPTRGIDVGAKHEIYRVILELAAAGTGVLVISSEIEELTGICDRIMVMRRGEISALDAGEFDREQILRAAL
jgi:ribose transport system ATP-binding protein